MTTWVPDVLGDGYQQLTLPLGDDPDGEGQVVATLVRYRPSDDPPRPRGAVLYVHGFTDYFFQQHVAEFFHQRGYAFHALDLRKSGRSLRPGQTAHFVTDLRFYDAELDESMRVIRDEVGDEAPVVLVAHSTGGLILPLWLDARASAGTPVRSVAGLVLNSPWFDLQGPAFLRSWGTALVDGVGRVSAKTVIPLAKVDSYGSSLHIDHHGEWSYDLTWKPLSGFPVTFGWMRAIRHGHARLHRGLDVGVPSLVLRSKRSRHLSRYGDGADAADLVLDVRQIARWAGCLGDRTTIAPVEGARHDVFLSTEVPRTRAFEEVDRWLGELAEVTEPTARSIS
ncbi:alpha/beta hydrolase [Rhodococcus sp. HNM0569]|uniref:alpha/beta fold hydrolase n=1 Tax=Rhodococcus sp. HNM0569 TaxID=2716340 RepID=UPI00146EE3D7|nr:alpha/beta hydrolase [Rhodococcus sp. HNM0569]